MHPAAVASARVTVRPEFLRPGQKPGQRGLDGGDKLVAELQCYGYRARFEERVAQVRLFMAVFVAPAVAFAERVSEFAR